MKNLLFLLIALIGLSSCNKDDNPVSNNTNTGTGWNLVYSKLTMDSIQFRFGSPVTETGNIDLTKYNKIWVKFEYKADSTFKYVLISNSSIILFTKIYTIPVQNNWYNENDSTKTFTSPVADICKYQLQGGNNNYACIKNLEIYLK